jgi:hypothetical protein
LYGSERNGTRLNDAEEVVVLAPMPNERDDGD